MGPALTSFRGMVLFAYFDPLIVMLLVQFAIYLATEPAGEVESNLVDLLLARPMPRHVIVSRTFLVMAFGTLLMVGAMQATTWAGLWWMAPGDAQGPAARCRHRRRRRPRDRRLSRRAARVDLGAGARARPLLAVPLLRRHRHPGRDGAGGEKSRGARNHGAGGTGPRLLELSTARPLVRCSDSLRARSVVLGAWYLVRANQPAV